MNDIEFQFGFMEIIFRLRYEIPIGTVSQVEEVFYLITSGVDNDFFERNLRFLLDKKWIAFKDSSDSCLNYKPAMNINSYVLTEKSFCLFGCYKLPDDFE